MDSGKKLGLKLKKFRMRIHLRSSQVAKETGIDRTYLSKIEHGRMRPRLNELNVLVNKYRLSNLEAGELFELAGFEHTGLVREDKRKEVHTMEKNSLKVEDSTESKGTQINVPPNTPILYSDSVFITSSPYGIVFDFAQNVGSTNQQNIVSRIGVSREHAKALLRVLQDRLEKDEQKENMKRVVS